MKSLIVFLILSMCLHSKNYEQFERIQKFNQLRQEHRSLQGKISSLQKKIVELKEEFEDFGDGRIIMDPANVCDGRLTLEAGVEFSTTDQTAKTNIIFTPYKGSTCAFYTGTTWANITFSETSLGLGTLISATNYDVFAYNNSGTLALELSSNWTSDTVRTDALSSVDGVLVKSTATTRRYLGTLRTTSTTTTESSISKRYVWNYLHRIPNYLYVKEGTNTWTYNVNTWRQANAGATNAVSYVAGLNESLLSVRCMAIINAGSNYYACGVGIDSTTTNSATTFGTGTAAAVVNQSWGEYKGYPGQGYHALNWLEIGDPGTAFTVWGDNGDGTRYQSGMVVELEN